MVSNPSNEMREYVDGMSYIHIGRNNKWVSNDVALEWTAISLVSVWAED